MNYEIYVLQTQNKNIHIYSSSFSFSYINTFVLYYNCCLEVPYLLNDEHPRSGHLATGCVARGQRRAVKADAVTGGRGLVTGGQSQGTGGQNHVTYGQNVAADPAVDRVTESDGERRRRKHTGRVARC